MHLKRGGLTERAILEQQLEEITGGIAEEIDRALIRQFDLLPVARKMVMEELANGQQN